MILGHIWALIAHLAKKEFLEKIYSSDFYLLIVPCHAAKFEKFLRAYPELQTCVILHHNWVIIAHLTQESIFWKTSLVSVYDLLIVPHHAAKLVKTC